MGKRKQALMKGEARDPTLGDRVEYLWVRALATVLLCTDVRGAARIGSFLAGIFGRIDRRHRHTAMDNLRRAYAGSLSEEEVRRTARRVYERIGVTAAEVLHAPRRLRRTSMGKFLRVEGAEELRRVTGGGPIIFHAAHLGNWEFLIPGARFAGIDIVSVARPMDNPLMDRWVASVRASIGYRPLPKYGALRELVKVVRAGRSVGIVSDQNGGRHGRLATFFGRPASTQAAGISLARRLGVHWVFGYIERVRVGEHRIRLNPPRLVPDDDAAEQAEIEELNRQVEEAIRRRPEDWMWLHRRWRIKADWGFPVEPTEGGRKR
ncbi:MAG: lysophospholipid acyltransferase family protein [Planctomycetes bacterium]|nr:lysophospholipid acyltransferase family protein [Planctomycetota bacterium]